MPEPKTLPNFLIIGAPRAGTTTLYYWLQRHPEIYMSQEKEPGFFAFAGQSYVLSYGRKVWLPPYSMDIEAYSALFQGSEGYPMRGEASTTYLASPKAPELIKQFLPGVKLIAILRNPIDRAYSHYLFNCRHGSPVISFEQALQLEEKERSNPFNDPSNWYKYVGRYADHLKTYYSLFSAEQMRLYLFEDLVQNPKGLYKDILEFLEVDSAFELPDDMLKKRYNHFGTFGWLSRLYSLDYNHPFRKWVKKWIPMEVRYYLRKLGAKESSPPPIPIEVKRDLVSYYFDQILELEDLLHRDLSHWLVV